MTNGAVKGNNLLLYIGAMAIACTKQCSISLKRNTIDATCKDLDGAEQFLLGGTSGTISASGIWKFDANYGIEDLMDAFLAGTLITAKWSTEVAGDFKLECPALIDGIDGQSNVNDVVSFTASFKISGTIVKSTIA